MLKSLKKWFKKYLLAIFIFFITFTFIFSNFLMIEYLKEQKRMQKINVKELQNLSKEEIIKYIEKKQEEQRPLYFLDYIYLAMIVISYFSGAITVYLIMNRENKKNIKRISSKLQKNILQVFPIKYRKVIEELIKSNGQESQATLRQKLGLDKVQMTRLIKRMEEEGFVVVKRGSKINYVELSDKLKELFNLT